MTGSKQQSKPMWFDRKGEVITVDQWSELCAKGPDYAIVRDQQMANGDLTLVTVWTGFDPIGERVNMPSIFETRCLMSEGTGGLRDMAGLAQFHRHYDNEADAIAGHEEMTRHITRALEHANLGELASGKVKV